MFRVQIAELNFKLCNNIPLPEETAKLRLILVKEVGNSAEEMNED